MAWNRQDSKGSREFLINIVSNTFSIGFKKTPKKSTPVSKKEITDYYYTSQFKHSITRGWVGSLILRHADEIIQTKSVSQEQQRLQVPRLFLNRIVQNLNEHVQGRVA
jgi:hypothetical protein